MKIGKMDFRESPEIDRDPKKADRASLLVTGSQVLQLSDSSCNKLSMVG